MFENCIMVNSICGFCGKDKNKELRCGYTTGENHIKDMKSCPRKSIKKRATVSHSS